MMIPNNSAIFTQISGDHVVCCLSLPWNDTISIHLNRAECFNQNESRNKIVTQHSRLNTSVLLQITACLQTLSLVLKRDFPPQNCVINYEEKQ